MTSQTTTTHRIQKAVGKLRSELRLAEEHAKNHRHFSMRDYYRGRAKAIKHSLSLVDMVMAENLRLRDQIDMSQDKVAELTERVAIVKAGMERTSEILRKGTPG